MNAPTKSVPCARAMRTSFSRSCLSVSPSASGAHRKNMSSVAWLVVAKPGGLELVAQQRHPEGVVQSVRMMSEQMP